MDINIGQKSCPAQVVPTPLLSLAKLLTSYDWCTGAAFMQFQQNIGQQLFTTCTKNVSSMFLQTIIFEALCKDSVHIWNIDQMFCFVGLAETELLNMLNHLHFFSQQ